MLKNGPGCTVYTHSTKLWGIQAIEADSGNMHCALSKSISVLFPSLQAFTFFIFLALSFPRSSSESPAPWHALPSLQPSVIKPAAVTSGACTAVLAAIPAHTKRHLSSEIYLEVLAMASAGTGILPS